MISRREAVNVGRKKQPGFDESKKLSSKSQTLRARLMN